MDNSLDRLLDKKVYLSLIRSGKKCSGILKRTHYGYYLQSEVAEFNKFHFSLFKVSEADKNSIQLKHSPVTVEEFAFFTDIDNYFRDK